MAIFMAVKLAPELLPQISVAAYSYMALMPLIQPPVMRLLTSRRERMIRMKQMRTVSRIERIAFPIVIGIIVNLFLPPVAPLITMLMLGNLFKEVLVTERLAKTAANEVMNVVIVILTVAIGSTMEAEQVPHRAARIEILVLGLIAFIFGTGSGVIGAKIMNLFLKEKINPLLGSAGIASVPIAARVAHIVALRGRPRELPDLPRHGPEPRRRVRHRPVGRHHARAAAVAGEGDPQHVMTPRFRRSHPVCPDRATAGCQYVERSPWWRSF